MKEITCDKCGHKWMYKGQGGIVRCPKCHSARNSFNRERFGCFTPWWEKRNAEKKSKIRIAAVGQA